VGRREGQRLTLLSEMTSNGERAVLAFDDPVSVETFRVTESLGAEWEVIKGGPQAAAELVGRCAEEGVRYVAIEPPARLTQGEKESARIPIRVFIDHLLEG
jgi:hypothetical protein